MEDDPDLGIGNRELLNVLQWIALLLVVLAVIGGVSCWFLWRLVDAAV